MHHFLISGLVIISLAVIVGCWLGWQLLRQNGRILLRLDSLEQRFEELELPSEPSGNGKNNSLARSRIKRDGLKTGAVAPDFHLPRVDGGELSLGEFRGRCLLLVFSDPHCGPCNHLAPRLEQFHAEQSGIAVLMISRRDLAENRTKMKEHGLTFPVVLQQHWEISRLYAMFATPMAYLVDENGIIAADVAVGIDAIQTLIAQAATPTVSRPLAPQIP